jgi:hypothetical protein
LLPHRRAGEGVRGMATVVIVPPEGSRGIERENRLWAAQFAAADPRNRQVVSLAANTPEAVLAATERAVTLAGREGEIVYAVGHGGAGSSAQAGQADFAPQGRFRVTQFLAYFEDQTGTWNGPSISAMQAEAGRIAGLPRGQARRRDERAWCGRYIADACELARNQILDLGRLQPHYLALCQLLHRTPVRRVNLLTCNVASAEDFLDELATDLGVPVRAYTVRVMSQVHRRGRDSSVRMFLEGDPDGVRTNILAAETELLPGMEREQYRTGRVRARPSRSTHAPGTRRQRVPQITE